MGSTQSSLIDNIADISVRSNDIGIITQTSGARALLHRFSHGNSSPTPITYSGELSSKLDNLLRNVSLEEPNAIKIKISFKLNTTQSIFDINLAEYDYANRVFQGTGNITFVSEDTVSSIPICIDSLTIDPDADNLVRATYKGYISKDIDLSQGYNMNACVTCLIKLNALDI
jgi:hypothetical protein